MLDVYQRPTKHDVRGSSVSQGKVIFMSVTAAPEVPLPARGIAALAEADIIIWATDTAPDEVLRHAPANADIVHAGRGTTSSFMPFYDLACRDGFRIAYICSEQPFPNDAAVEQIQQCVELGLPTEIAQYW